MSEIGLYHRERGERQMLRFTCNDVAWRSSFRSFEIPILTYERYTDFRSRESSLTAVRPPTSPCRWCVRFSRSAIDHTSMKYYAVASFSRYSAFFHSRVFGAYPVTMVITSCGDNKKSTPHRTSYYTTSHHTTPHHTSALDSAWVGRRLGSSGCALTKNGL